MAEIRTHAEIDPELVGRASELADGFARVELTASRVMAADERGLVHGGFLFGLADYAAMLAVNDPHVVLAKSHCRFLKPVVVGDRLAAEAAVRDQDGAKKLVDVEVKRGDVMVMSGEFYCYTPDRHVLER